MARACTICANPDRPAIDAALSAGEGLRAVAARHGVTKSALARHREHMGRTPAPPTLAPVRRRARPVAPPGAPVSQTDLGGFCRPAAPIAPAPEDDAPTCAPADNAAQADAPPCPDAAPDDPDTCAPDPETLIPDLVECSADEARLREVVRLSMSGLTQREIGARFGVSARTVRNWLKPADSASIGSGPPRPMTCCRPCLSGWRRWKPKRSRRRRCGREPQDRSGSDPAAPRHRQRHVPDRGAGRAV